MGVKRTIKGRIHLIFIIYRDSPPSPSAREGSGYIWEGYGGGELVLTESKGVNIVSVRRDNTICKGVTIPETKKEENSSELSVSRFLNPGLSLQDKRRDTLSCRKSNRSLYCLPQTTKRPRKVFFVQDSINALSSVRSRLLRPHRTVPWKPGHKVRTRSSLYQM